MNKTYDFKSITENFNLEGELKTSDSHVCGHINDTFIINCEGENGEEIKYVLQRVNSDIFKNPEQLMENIENVTSHIKNKIIEENGDPLRETLNIVKTKEGKSFYKCKEENYWRIFNFIHGASTYQIVEKPEHLYTAGKALGKFQKQLSDFNVDMLYDTIPDFHNTEKRFEVFMEAVREDKKGEQRM